MEQFMVLSIFLSVFICFLTGSSLAEDADPDLVISENFVVNRCWAQTKSSQTCNVKGALGKAGDTISIYDGSKWVAAGKITKRKGSKTTVLVDERFEVVRSGFIIINNSADDPELNPKYMFSKPDSY